MRTLINQYAEERWFSDTPTPRWAGLDEWTDPLTFEDLPIDCANEALHIHTGLDVDKLLSE